MTIGQLAALVYALTVYAVAVVMAWQAGSQGALALVAVSAGAAYAFQIVNEALDPSDGLSSPIVAAALWAISVLAVAVSVALSLGWF